MIYNDQWFVALLVVAAFVGFLFLLGAVVLHLYLRQSEGEQEELEICNSRGEVFHVLGYARLYSENRALTGWRSEVYVVRAVQWMYDTDAQGRAVTTALIRVQGKWFNADHWEPVEKEESDHEPQDISA